MHNVQVGARGPIRRRFEALDGHKTFVLLWPRRQLNTDEEINGWVARIGRLKAPTPSRALA